MPTTSTWREPREASPPPASPVDSVTPVEARPAVRPWALAALATWVVGVQVLEGAASVGLVGCVLLALWAAWKAGWTAVKAGLWAWWPLGLVLGWALLASTLAGRPPSGSGVARLFDWVAIPAAAWALGTVGPRGARILLWATGVTLLVSSAVAGLQHFGIWPGPEKLSALLHIKLAVVRVYEPIPGAEGRFMGGGLLFHRLKFAHVSGLAVLALLAFGLRARGRERVLALAAATVGLVAIVAFPYARAGSAALVAACVAVIVLGSPHRKLALVLGAVLALGAVGVVMLKPSLRNRFASSLTQQGSGDRVLLHQAGLDAVKKYPVVGTGAGRFRVGEWAEASAPTAVREHRGKSHIQFLSIAAEQGVPGLVAFLVMLAVVARRLRPGNAAGVAAIGGLLFFLMLSVLHDPLYHAPFSMALVLMLAAGVRGSQAAALPQPARLP